MTATQWMYPLARVATATQPLARSVHLVFLLNRQNVSSTVVTAAMDHPVTWRCAVTRSSRHKRDTGNLPPVELPPVSFRKRHFTGSWPCATQTRQEMADKGTRLSRRRSSTFVSVKGPSADSLGLRRTRCLKTLRTSAPRWSDRCTAGQPRNEFQTVTREHRQPKILRRKLQEKRNGRGCSPRPCVIICVGYSSPEFHFDLNHHLRDPAWRRHQRRC